MTGTISAKIEGHEINTLFLCEKDFRNIIQHYEDLSDKYSLTINLLISHWADENE